MNDIENKAITPNILRKGSNTWSKTKYGSYIDDDLAFSSYAQQKNAMSYRELIKLGYR